MPASPSAAPLGNRPLNGTSVGSAEPQRQGCDRSLAGELSTTGEDGGAGGTQPDPDAGSGAQPVEHHIGHLRHRVGEKDQTEVGRRRCRIELIEHALQQLRPRPAGSEDQPVHERRQAACGTRLLKAISTIAFLY